METNKNYQKPEVIVQETKLRATLLSGSNYELNGKDEITVPTGTQTDEDLSVD